jgi:hypothetical protein
MPKVGYFELTKIDCESKNHLSLSEKLVICNCYN